MATILLIDDNETIRDGLAHVVKKMGHTPVTAASGRPPPSDFAVTRRSGSMP